MKYTNPADLPLIASTRRSGDIRSLAGPISAPAVIQAPAHDNDQLKINLPANLDTFETSPRRAAATPTATTTTQTLDWRVVDRLRSKASEELNERKTNMVGDNGELDQPTLRQLGIDIINRLIDEEEMDRPRRGLKLLDLNERLWLQQAIRDALFGYGRLQPLIDDETVENIVIAGSADNVWIERTDGELIRVAPVADSNEELLRTLQFMASRGEGGRSFSTARPSLHMRLDGGSRLAAAAWVTAGPSVVIRRHRLRKVTLDDLVARKMITADMAAFLRAAVKAKLSIVVAGPQGAGKTTLIRALCAEIDSWEAIGTFETEFELMLHELTDVHPIVHAWEARPGTNEYTPDGRQAGEFSLNDAIFDSFRFNLSRQIVGEVRGSEVWAMIKAMESGAGSMSTTHSRNALAAMHKLVTCAMEAGPQITKELAVSKLSGTIDLVVQVHLETRPVDGQAYRRERWVSEILAISPGEAQVGFAHTHVYKPNPAGGPAIFGTFPDHLGILESYGFNPQRLGVLA